MQMLSQLAHSFGKSWKISLICTLKFNWILQHKHQAIAVQSYFNIYSHCAVTQLSSIRNLTTDSNHTMEEDIDKYFQVALELTKNAGKLISERMYAQKTVETKSGNIDFVTETDTEVEKILIQGLSNCFPDHRFIGEETVSSGGHCELTEAPTWIIDPVDGTMNFVHGFPHCCISIGLFINCEPEIAIIYNPVLTQLFTAVKNKGAFLNGKRIHVSKEKDLSNALIMHESGTSKDPEKLDVVYKNLRLLIPQVHGIRSLGSAALNMSMVALGGADAGFEYGIHIWDIAAGELIIKEAGGVLVDPAGGPLDRLSRRVLYASTEELAKQLSEKLVQFYPLPRD